MSDGRQLATVLPPDRLRLVGALVRDERVKIHGSMERAAQAAGVDYRTWKRIENGLPVRLKTYANIEGALGLPPGSVREGITARPAPSPGSGLECRALAQVLEEIAREVRQLRLAVEAALRPLG